MEHPHQIRTFRDGDLTLSYEIHGSGERTLIYLHGLLLDAAVNRRLARDLADAGNRVVLLDLPGHGASDKPLTASAHRMDAYARNVQALIDELGADRVVVGGMSLGADVALQLGAMTPGRVAGLIIEMPVLEQATPFAALLFTPLLIATHYAAPLLRGVQSVARRIPRNRLGPLDQVFAPLLLDPDEMVAVLHGILVGPVGPTVEERATISVPTLVVGHRSDRLHPIGDASRLAKVLPNARLLEARSIWELRVTPTRLTEQIEQFLDEVWDREDRVRRRTGRRAAN